MENSMPRMSRKDLRAMAGRMGAVEILGRKSNIYNYEAERDKAIKKIGGKLATYEGVAYSGGVYGNTGRIDAVKSFDPKTEKWKTHGYTFYTS